MKFFCLGATLGWVGSTIWLAGNGTANIGTIFTGIAVALLWLAYLAFRAEVRP